MHTDFNPNIDYFSLSRACLEFVTDIEEKKENGQISERKSRFDLGWLSRVRWSDHGAGVEITYGTRGSFTATLRSYRLILLVRLRRLLCSLLFNHFVFVSIIGGSQIIAFRFWLWLCIMGCIGVNCHSSFVSRSSLTPLFLGAGTFPDYQKFFYHVFGCSEAMIVVLNEQRDGIHPPI